MMRTKSTKFIFSLFVIFFALNVQGQTYDNPGGTITTCSGTFYDSGGSAGNYSNNESTVTTFCSGTSDCIELTFTSFDTESCCDDFIIYDGASTADAIIGSYAGSTSPGVITSSSGCITIEFTSDGSIAYGGWEASIACVSTCSTPPVVPTNTDCSVPDPICSGSPIVFTAQSNGTEASTVNPGNDYDCLFTSPNPSWYYLEIATGGDLAIDITAGSDIDFELWGPFADYSDAISNCDSYGVPIDCSYSTAAVEQANATGVVAGEVYVLLVTNYANTVQTITVDNTASSTATTDCSIVTLPVELVNFDGHKLENEIILSWTTVSELNNNYFIVERSIDGTVWEAIDLVNGNGTTTQTTNYESIDRNFKGGTNYYRLKQFDFNGQIQYSDIIAIVANNDINISLVPNPAKSSVVLSTSEFFTQVNIINMQGITVESLKFDSIRKTTIDINALSKGVYNVYIHTDKGTKVERLIVM